METMILFFII